MVPKGYYVEMVTGVGKRDACVKENHGQDAHATRQHILPLLLWRSGALEMLGGMAFRAPRINEGKRDACPTTEGFQR